MLNNRLTGRGASLVLALAAGAAIGIGGCSSPLAVQSERTLQRSVLESVNREVAEARQYPETKMPDPGPSIEVLQLRPELIPVIEGMAGPASYDPRAISSSIGQDLVGREQRVVMLTLETAVRSAATYNLQVQFARLQPAIAETQVIAAESAFDWVFSNNTEYSNLDQPRAQTRQGLSTSGNTNDERQTLTNATALRRQLTSGGQFTFQQDLNYSELDTPGVSSVPSPVDEVAWTLRFDQPLLQNFGSDVNLAQVRINRNAERDAIARLKQNLIQQITEAERLYWQLVQAQRNVLILQRLYDRGVQTRDQVIAREILDATPAQVAQARATVESRRADIIRAQNTLRQQSDLLKAAMNLPNVVVGDETLVLPVDDPLVEPITYSLVDVLTNSVRNRPEMAQALLSIDNTSIRQQVADNARLPRLDLRLQTRLAGLDDNYGDAYGEVFDGDFVDYLVGVNFEQRLGNRGAESIYRQRRLERMQATIAYRNTIQQVLLEAKRALRTVVTNFQLIGQTRVARYAAAEQLRSFQVEKQLITGFSVQTLDLEFRQQESLAQAEQEEIFALTDYNIALALLYQAMGTALERNNIEFAVPNADDPLMAGGIESPQNPVVDMGKNTYVSPPPGPVTWPWRRGPAEQQPTPTPTPVIDVPPAVVLPPVAPSLPPGPNVAPAGTPAAGPGLVPGVTPPPSGAPVNPPPPPVPEAPAPVVPPPG